MGLAEFNAAFQAFQVVARRLFDLPTTSDGIAYVVAAEGIRGRREHGSECAFARYLRRDLDIGGLEVHVDKWAIVVSWGDCHLTIDTPKHIVQFLAAFDSRYYPELVEA